MERLMREFLGEGLNTARKWAYQCGAKPLHTHWDEKDGSYIVSSEVPGLEKDRVTVTYKDDYLTVKADYSTEDEEKCECGCMRTGEYSFNGYFPGIDASKIDAQLKNGILTITLPKGAEVAGTTIDIKSE
jgi:HSP20 family protein